MMGLGVCYGIMTVVEGYQGHDMEDGCGQSNYSV
jgi:hypothetical protein